MKHRAAVLLLAGIANSARAADKPDLCSERPGITTNECVIDAGHAQIETSLADWTRETHGGERKDNILFGDTLVRIGAGHGLELRIGWTPFGYERDSEESGVSRFHRVGDVIVGLKQNIVDARAHGDVGLSFALLPFAMLPVGRMPIGAGTWGAGAQLPIGYRIDERFKLEFTPIVEAAPDGDGAGRHLRWSGALGAKYNPTDQISFQLEEQVERDDDPDRMQRGTFVVTGLSIADQPSDHLQIDLGTSLGMSRKTPDAEVYAGFTRLF